MGYLPAKSARARRDRKSGPPNEQQSGGGQSATASDRTAKSNDKFAGITSREMLEELQARGYKWNSLWLEKVKIEKQFVKL